VRITRLNPALGQEQHPRTAADLGLETGAIQYCLLMPLPRSTSHARQAWIYESRFPAQHRTASRRASQPPTQQTQRPSCAIVPRGPSYTHLSTSTSVETRLGRYLGLVSCQLTSRMSLSCLPTRACKSRTPPAHPYSGCERCKADIYTTYCRYCQLSGRGHLQGPCSSIQGQDNR